MSMITFKIALFLIWREPELNQESNLVIKRQRSDDKMQLLQKPIPKKYTNLSAYSEIPHKDFEASSNISKMLKADANSSL